MAARLLASRGEGLQASRGRDFSSKTLRAFFLVLILACEDSPALENYTSRHLVKIRTPTQNVRENKMRQSALHINIVVS